MKLKKWVLVALIFSLILHGCTSIVKSDKIKDGITNKVQADLETSVMDAGLDDDSADDPAIWLNPLDPSKSLIFGTNKKGGLAVFDLAGKQIHFYPVGKINNVDVLYGFVSGNDTVDVVGASNRSDSTITLMAINPETLELTDISARKIVSGIGDVYGFCFYKSPENGKSYAFVNSKEGKVEQWELFETDGKIDAAIARRLTRRGQVEGMVCDNEMGTLYIGEEKRGIWKLSAEPNGGDEFMFLPESGTLNENIAFDMEGLSIYYAPEGQGYLIASSQGNFSYAIFERSDENRYITSFRIVSGEVDGTEETDGIDVINRSVGNAFPSGLFVVQDGFNFDNDKKKPQNFKFISWDKIARLTNPPLLVTPDYIQN